MPAPAPANGTTARSPRKALVSLDGTRLARVTKWDLNAMVETSKWGDSDSEGFTNRLAARADGTGTIEGKFDNVNPPYNVFAPGDNVQIDLFETDVAGDYWTFPNAQIESFKIQYDQDTKEAVGWTADFGADGRFYRPHQSGAPSRTYPT